MSLALHYWMGDVHHCSRVPVSEMTYTVSSGTLNSTIPYHTAHLGYILHYIFYVWTVLCFFLPTFALIRQSLIEIQPKDDFQHGGRPPYWIICDVVILHQSTLYYIPNIVLNFHLDWFSTFWYTWSFMFHPSGWKLPIQGQILGFWRQIWSFNYSFLTPKRHILHDTVF